MVPRDAAAKLRQQVTSAGGLPAGDRNALEAWLTQTRIWLVRAFGQNASECAAFEMAGPGESMALALYAGPSEVAQHLRDQVAAKVSQLEALISVLDQSGPVDEPASEVRQPAAASKKVFVVHGHHGEAKESVARFLEKLGLEAVILHERPNRGMTIIEKVEAHSGVAFAVVLLTPDDPMPSGLPRARQNVILELGYFIGKLGRAQVCALYMEGTDIPSDFDGVVYVPLDAGGAWRLKLAKELKTVLPVDMNDAL